MAVLPVRENATPSCHAFLDLVILVLSLPVEFSVGVVLLAALILYRARAGAWCAYTAVTVPQSRGRIVNRGRGGCLAHALSQSPTTQLTACRCNNIEWIYKHKLLTATRSLYYYITATVRSTSNHNFTTIRRPRSSYGSQRLQLGLPPS